MGRTVIVLYALLSIVINLSIVWAGQRNTRGYKVVYVPEVGDESSEDYDDDLVRLLKPARSKSQAVKQVRPVKIVKNYISYRDNEDDDDDNDRDYRKERRKDRHRESDDDYDRHDRYRDRYWDDYIRRDGGNGGCCDSGYSDSLRSLAIPLSIALWGVLLYYLLTNNNNNNNNTGRGARMVEMQANHRFSHHQFSDVMLDGPTWLSMVHELWEQDDSSENMACIQETLCRMNRLAMGAPGQAGWAVSLSSLPLSYLLHARHTGGFTSYIDAALMGRSGANCTELYSSCPRLHY